MPPSRISAFERWQQFSYAADLSISDDELRNLAEPLEHLMAAVRRVLDQDLGFIEPVVVLKFPESGA